MAIDNKNNWPNLTLMPDASILTAYHRSRLLWRQRYHMGVVFWQD